MDIEQLITEVANALREVDCRDIIFSSGDNEVVFRFNFGGDINLIHAPMPTPGWTPSVIELDALDNSRAWKVTYERLLP